MTVDANEFLVDLVIASVAFALASWRFPFVHETGFLTLLFGGFLLATYLAVSFMFFLMGRPHYFLNRTFLLAFGLGFIVHGCTVLLFGRRLATKQKPDQTGSQEAESKRPPR